MPPALARLPMMVATRAKQPAFWVLALGVALIITVFYPGVHGGFIFDDRANIAENPALFMLGLDHVSAWRAASSYPYAPGLRLLPMLSFGLDYFRTGSFDPLAFKATNVALHVLAFCVLTGFLRTLLRQAQMDPKHATWVGLAVALAWAVHPLQVSSVLYAVQRMQTMANLFLLLALWSYLDMRRALMEGNHGGRAALKMAFYWLLALMSKEDAALLPAYTLALELTVLQFSAANAEWSRRIKLVYASALIAGIALFFYWGVPRFWSSEPFFGRDFNSYERLLTQGRVLCLYLGQTVWPWPDSMPFYYDNYAVSRGWQSPPATWMAWLFLGGLAALGWIFRRSRPVFALGVLWFFVGHFVTSNMLGLELVFEHRNQLPMVGILLALFDVCRMFASAITVPKTVAALTAGAIIALLGTGTWARSTLWGDPLALAQATTRLAPHSGRAWVDLCQIHHQRSQGDSSSPEYDLAVDACMQGAEQARSVMAMSNAILLKASRGDLRPQDWDHLGQLLRSTTFTPEYQRIAVSLIDNATHGLALPTAQVVDALDSIHHRGQLAAEDGVKIGFFIWVNTDSQEHAMRYFRHAVTMKAYDTAFVEQLLSDMRSNGLGGAAVQLEAQWRQDTRQ